MSYFTVQQGLLVSQGNIQLDPITANITMLNPGWYTSGSGANGAIFTDIADTGINGANALPSIFQDAATARTAAPVAANLIANGNLPARFMMAAGGGGGGSGQGFYLGFYAPTNTNYISGGPAGGGGGGGLIIIDQLYVPPNAQVSSTQSRGGAGGAQNDSISSNSLGANGAPGADLSVTIGSTTYTTRGGGFGGRGGVRFNNNADLTTRGGDGGSGGGGAKTNNNQNYSPNWDVAGRATLGTQTVSDYAYQGQNGGNIVRDNWWENGAASGGGGFNGEGGRPAGAFTGLGGQGGDGGAHLYVSTNPNRSDLQFNLVLASAGGAGGRNWGDSWDVEGALTPGGSCFQLATNFTPQTQFQFLGGNGGGGRWTSTTQNISSCAGTGAANAAGATGRSNVVAILQNQGAFTSLGVTPARVFSGGHGGGGGGWVAGAASRGGEGANGFFLLSFRSTQSASNIAITAFNPQLSLGLRNQGNIVIFGNTTPTAQGQSNIGAFQTQGGVTVAGNLFARGNLLFANNVTFITSQTLAGQPPSVGEIFQGNPQTGIRSGLQISYGNIYNINAIASGGDIANLQIRGYAAGFGTQDVNWTGPGNVRCLGSRDAAPGLGSPTYWIRVN